MYAHDSITVPYGKAQNLLLLYMYNSEPRITFSESSYASSPFSRLLNNEEISECLSASANDSHEQPEEKLQCLKVIQVLHHLIDLEYLDVELSTEKVTGSFYTREQCEDPLDNPANMRLSEFKRNFKNVSVERIANDLWVKATSTIRDCKAPEDFVEKSIDDVNPDTHHIVSLTYHITSKGYEIAMALASHEDNQEVRRASISASLAAKSSSTTAGRALFAAWTIALASGVNAVFAVLNYFDS